MKLILKLIIGIVAGIVIGLFSPEAVTKIFITLKMIFGQLIGFAVPLIILFFITSGISTLGKNSGRMLGLNTGLAYASTILAGLLAFTMAILSFEAFDLVTGHDLVKGVSYTPYFEFTIAPLMGVMTALFTAFFFGIGITKTESSTLKGFFDQGKDIIELFISKILIPILPLYIASIFVDLAATGTVWNTLQTFGLVLLLALLTHWIWLTSLFIFAGISTKRNPFPAMKVMMPAYFTALGTMSSAATIPVTLKQVKQNKIKEEVADFTIPFSAAIHLPGSTITIVLCATAVMIMTTGLGMPSLAQMLPFILVLGVIMIAAPGVPGGAVMAALGLLGSMLGFNETAIGLMIALYMAQDSFGTACNVTGDGAIAMLVDKYSK